MFRKLINICRAAYRFIVCKHDFVLLGTTKHKGKTKMVCECKKCKIVPVVDAKQMNFLIKKCGVRVRN